MLASELFYFLTFKLGAESGVDNPNLRAMKTVFRIMPLIILPMTINFPTVRLLLPFYSVSQFSPVVPCTLFSCGFNSIWVCFLF